MSRDLLELVVEGPQEHDEIYCAYQADDEDDNVAEDEDIIDLDEE